MLHLSFIFNISTCIFNVLPSFENRKWHILLTNNYTFMSKKTLVVGASLKPQRYSNLAIHRLTQYMHEVVAYGLRKGEVAGVSILTEFPEDKDIDTVTLYLNPLRQQEYYQKIIDLKPKRIIFNPGTENPTFYDMLDKANINYEVACTLVLLSTNQY